MPAVAEQHAGVDEDGAGELAGVGGGPPQAPGAAEVVDNEVGSVDAEGVQRLPMKAACPSTVCGKSRGLPALPKPGASQATARHVSLARSSRPGQSALDPGLP